MIWIPISLLCVILFFALVPGVLKEHEELGNPDHE